MPMSFDQMVDEVSKWPADIVAEFIDRVMLAKHGGISPSVDAAWRKEFRRRIDDLENGRVTPIEFNEIVSKAKLLLDP